jgi:hypothetical protein
MCGRAYPSPTTSMFSLDSHNDLIRVTCDCGKVHLMRTPEVRRHDCPLTGKAVIYWPEGYVAEKKEKRQVLLVKPSLPREKLTDEQRAKRTEERKRLAAERKALLGNKIETFLTSWGVTTEWWVSFKEKFGLPPLCNCAARKEWFNNLGESLPWAAGIGVKLLEFLTRKPDADKAL